MEAARALAQLKGHWKALESPKVCVALCISCLQPFLGKELSLQILLTHFYALLCCHAAQCHRQHLLLPTQGCALLCAQARSMRGVLCNCGY